MTSPAPTPPAALTTRDQDCAAWEKFRAAQFPLNPFHVFASGRESARMEYVYAEEVRRCPALLAHLARSQIALGELIKMAEAWAGPTKIESPALCEARKTYAELQRIGRVL